MQSQLFWTYYIHQVDLEVTEVYLCFLSVGIIDMCYCTQSQHGLFMSGNQMDCIINNRVLPFYYGWQSRTRTTVCVVLLASVISLTNSLQGVIPCLALNFSFNNSYLLWETLSTHAQYRCSNTFRFEIYFLLGYKLVGFHKDFSYTNSQFILLYLKETFTKFVLDENTFGFYKQ